MFISYNQSETNQYIYEEIKKATKHIHITTMFFNDSDLSLNFIKLLNDKIKEVPNIKIEINIGLNPFLKSNLSFENLDRKIHFRTIPMHIINTYHIRLFYTENVFAVGGIDITKLNLSKVYIQFTLFIPIQPSQNIYISNEIMTRNILYDFTIPTTNYNISKIDPYLMINNLINESKEHIFIDNQYIFSNEFVNKLIEKKNKNPNITIEIFSNINFSNNPIKNKNFFINNIVINPKFLTFLNTIIMKKLQNHNIIVKKNQNKYTHNKIFIFDKKYILMGSMNIMNKSLKHVGGDIEICVLIKNKKMANEILAYYKNILE